MARANAALLLALLLPAGLAPANAQTIPPLPRPDLRLSLSPLSDVNDLQLVAPPEDAPPAAPGLHRSRQLMYSVWTEAVGGAKGILFSRSLDGGFSWSTARPIYVVAGAETIENVFAAATLNQVYVAFLSSRLSLQRSPSSGDQDAFVIASADEGGTWSQALLVNTASAGQPVPGATGYADGDEITLAAAGGKAHVCWETDRYTRSAEEVMYAGVEFQQGQLAIFAPETRLNTLPAPGVADADSPRIAAGGPFVVAAWFDERVGATASGLNNLYVAVSATFGQSFATEVALTAHTLNPGAEDIHIAIAGPNLYVVHCDQRNTYDQVYLSFSNNGGVAWNKDRLVSDFPAGTADADRPMVYAEGMNVLVVWHDDRLGGRVNTLENDVFLVVDRQAGQGFLGPAPPANVRLESGLAPLANRLEHPRAAICGDYMAIVVEKSPYSATTTNWEDHALAISADGGRSWSPLRWVTQIGWAFNNGLGDVDAESAKGVSRIVLTPGLDLMMVWPDNRAYATAETNEAFRAGLRLPELAALAPGFGLAGARPADAGHVAILFVTDKGTAPTPWFDTFLGIELNFSFSLGFTDRLLAAGGSAFLAVVDAQGKAAFPGTPALPPWFLGTLHAAAVGLDPATLSFPWATDPVVYR